MMTFLYTKKDKNSNLLICREIIVALLDSFSTFFSHYSSNEKDGNEKKKMCKNSQLNI